jgi:hypothetical protein
MGEKAIHEALESLGSIAESEWHVKIFKKVERGDYCCFRNILGCQRNLVVAFYKIYGCENRTIMEFGSEIMKVGKGVGVRCCNGVKAAVITAGAPAAIFLWHHVKGRGPGAIGTANNASFFKLQKF